jgi:hypothetical protein
MSRLRPAVRIHGCVRVADDVEGIVDDARRRQLSRNGRDVWGHLWLLSSRTAARGSDMGPAAQGPSAAARELPATKLCTWLAAGSVSTVA